MTDDHAPPSGGPRCSKGRSASICGANSPELAELGARRGGRRPAARSQSARLTSNKGLKRRPTLPANSVLLHHGSNSEPKLAPDQEPQPQPAGRFEASPSAGRRKASVKRAANVPRKSTAFLDVPDRGQGGGGSSQEEDEDSYRLRSFSFSSKGLINRGDSFKRRSSRSINATNNNTTSSSPTLLPKQQQQQQQQPQQPSPEKQKTSSSSSSNKYDYTVVTSSAQPEVSTKYVVGILGAQGVGKAALISQFMTSEYINAYEGPKDGLDAQSVSIMLNGEESELTFQNFVGIREIDRTTPPDAFLVLYSVVDKASFLKAEIELRKLQDAELLRSRPAIMVGTKIDLARSRAVSTQDGKCLACTYRVKFIEISVGINHNVDELLVGILTQIRLQEEQEEEYGGSIHGGHHHHNHHWFNKNRGVVKASMKARQMFTWLFGKEDSKFKNCENLQAL